MGDFRINCVVETLMQNASKRTTLDQHLRYLYSLQICSIIMIA